MVWVGGWVVGAWVSRWLVGGRAGFAAGPGEAPNPQPHTPNPSFPKPSTLPPPLTHPSDIKITGYTMGLNGVELIKECSIELTIGRRYGLIGQNGSGKTNFLQCIANRRGG